MANKESANSLNEMNLKLCAAVEKYKCLHDQKSHSSTTPECIEAWKLVASECNVTVDFCKKRWQTLRKCFYGGLVSPENKYYFHDHLKFLLGGSKKKLNVVETLREVSKSTISEAITKRHQDVVDHSSQESEVKSLNTSGNNDAKSVSSWTSVDESDEIIEFKKQSGSGTINISEDEVSEVNKKRLKPKRSFKRPLELEDDDDYDDDELTRHESEEKCGRKSSSHNHKSQMPYKSVKIRLKKLKINASENEEDAPKSKMVDCCSQTVVIRTKDVATQYKFYSYDLDDTFIQVITTNLVKMNARQKMNFKRKIYQSMLEVFDDAADFPNSNGKTPVMSKQQVPFVDGTTTGELRLIRELVSLIQAAKTTPEIVNATDKPKTCATVNSKSPLKMPLPIVENHTKKETSPLSLSPCADDDDLQFFIDNLDDEDDVSLPLSWNELKTKTSEPAKLTKEDKSKGSPRYMVRKVVKASDPNASIIDKKRIYRVFPKMVNPNSNHASLNKSDKSSGSSLASSSNDLQISKKRYGIGTFYIAKPQNTTKVSSSVSNITARSLNNKPTNQTSNPIRIITQHTNSSSITTAINSQTVFKNIHPENRVLCSSTGCFQAINTKNTTGAPTIVQKSSSPLSARLSTSSKVMTTTLPITAKLSQTGHGCAPKSSGSTSEEALNTRGTVNVLQSNPKVDSIAKQIHISEPRTLNTNTIKYQPLSTTKLSSKIHSKITATSGDEDTKSPLKAVISTTSKECERIPTLETAGTVEADDLYPLFLKPQHVKSEPVDK